MKVINLDLVDEKLVYEKLDNDEDRKNFFGEKDFSIIEESQLAIDKKLTLLFKGLKPKNIYLFKASKKSPLKNRFICSLI